VHLFLLYQFCSHYHTTAVMLAQSWFICHGESQVQTNFHAFCLFKSFVSPLMEGISPHGKVLTTSMMCKENVRHLKNSKDIHYWLSNIESLMLGTYWTEDEPHGSIVVIGTFEAQWVHLWLTTQKSSQIVGLKVSFSIQDQQPAMRLISSRERGPTKGLWSAITCYNLNPIYFWPLHFKFYHYTQIWPNSGNQSVVLHPRPTTGYGVDIIHENGIN
jgi:hypothetical protein